jgi:acetyl esterase/lipase
VVFTAEMDRLSLEAEELAAKLEVAGKHLLLKRFNGVAHGWDKTTIADSDDARARDEAYDMVIRFLSDL